jgi:hypothetical protein
MLPIRELAVSFGADHSSVGVLAEPETNERDVNLPTVILLNAGIVHRVGPHRLYVALARELAAHGFCVLRFDFCGIGDSVTSSDSDAYIGRATTEVRQAMQFLTETVFATTYLILGFCSSVDVALNLILNDEKVHGAILVNGWPTTEISATDVAAAHENIQARYYQRNIFVWRSWRRLLLGRSDFHAIKRAIMGFLRGRSRNHCRSVRRDAVSEVVRQAVRERGIRLLYIFSEGSVMWDIFQLVFGPRGKSITELEGVELEFFECCDHIFTPAWSRQRFINRVVGWVVQFSKCHLKRRKTAASGQ